MRDRLASHTIWTGKCMAMRRKKAPWTYISYMDRKPGAQPLLHVFHVLFDCSKHPIDGFPWASWTQLRRPDTSPRCGYRSPADDRPSVLNG